MSEINDLINKIVKEAGQQAPHSETTVPTNKADKQAGHTKMTAADYPLFKKHPEMVNAPNGKNINEITIEAAINGQVKPEDLRIAPATLKAQGENGRGESVHQCIVNELSQSQVQQKLFRHLKS